MISFNFFLFRDNGRKMRSCGRLLSLLLLAFIPQLLLLPKQSTAATHVATSYTELTSGIASAVPGDTISILANIIVTADVNINKSLVLNGNGYTVTVPVPGLSDAGIYNSSPSAFRVFTLSGANTIVFNNMTIKGGSITAGGGAVTIPSGTTAIFSKCTITSSRSSLNAGGIYNAGICYLYNSYITRNAASYGGGFLNDGFSARFYLEYSTVTENRSLSSGGGGGGCENRGGAILYVNNSSFCNNQSTELGGAINNSSILYVCNSSFTGNVAYGSYRGGAIAVNGSTTYLINCLFGYNYYKSASGGGGEPTAFTLNDIEGFNGTVNMRYVTYMATTTTSGTINDLIGNTPHALAADGSDDDLFTGGSYGPIFDASGNIYGSANCYQPILVNINGMRVPTLRTGSFALAKGCEIGFTNGNGTPVVGFKDMTTNTWNDLLGSNASAHLITDDETGLTRAAIPASGALERLVDDYYILKVRTAPNGTVDGASIYGEVYPAGTAVTITALANNGYAFDNWSYNEGGTGTISTNPLTITLNANTTLTPSFSPSSGYTITYLGNDQTSGTPPPIGSYTASATIEGNTGNLAKTSFTFSGWNTASNGSGTDYLPGSTYSAGANLVLYAKWASTGVPLSVKLISFDAYRLADHVQIKWATANEVNNNHFEVQRSADGVKWETIEQIKGQPHSNTTVNYSTIDRQPLPGTSFYRLKQVDTDGSASYSPIKRIYSGYLSATQFRLLPNPSQGIVYLNTSSPANAILILNSLGQDISSQCFISKQAESSLELNCKALNNGIYIVKDAYNAQRMVIQR